ncbi:glycosyltransferase family 2 protein [Patescibacteria group bacterium]|nr:glycosyltransferase family 2 protein [Patescibacteria group bacterium]MCL5733437.1 glycosyltransferase family 2 protein [Patescibacteria group bacterium]
MEDRYLSIIIPAYNESERLPPTLVDINQKLKNVNYNYEIIVINDGSRDNTAEKVKIMINKGEVKNLKLIDNKENKGKGGVVRQGMLAAEGKIRLFTDADNSTSISHFEQMIPYFNQGYDVVIGSRALKGSRLDPPQPFSRRILGKLGNVFIQVMVLPGIWDTQCGFKAFSKEAALKIFDLSRISGWGFDVEALALAHHFGYKIKEIPVRWVNDTRSRVKGSAYLQVLLETIKIRWWLWSGKYNK